MPMKNLSVLMTFRLGPEQSYDMRCLWDLGQCYDEECAMTKSAGTGRDLMATLELVCF